MRKIVVAALLLLASALHADELTDRVGKIASSIDATVGVSAIDLATGRRFALRGDERFPMASVYKLPIAFALLKKVTTGEIKLDQPVTISPKEFAPGHSPLADSAGGKPVTLELGRLVVLSLSESDNTASDAMLRIAGGPEAVQRYLRFFGITGMDITRSELEMAADMKKLGPKFFDDERDTSTPNAMAMLLRQFDTRAIGLGSGSINFVIDSLRRSNTGAHRIRAGVPMGADVYTKTGTTRGVVNDAGFVKTPDGKHRMIVVIFTKGAKKSSEKAREEAVAGIARAVYEEFAATRR